MKTDQKDDPLVEGIRLIAEGMGKFRSGPLDFYLRSLLAARDLLLGKYAPFRPGDRVTLSKPFKFRNAPGWVGKEHFITPGEPATVESSEVSTEGELWFSIVFDNETYILDGEKKPVTSKHRFKFWEDQLTLIVPPTTVPDKHAKQVEELQVEIEQLKTDLKAEAERGELLRTVVGIYASHYVDTARRIAENTKKRGENEN